MAAKNDITGDSIISRHSKAYDENIEKIFGDKSAEREAKAKAKAEYFAKLNAETKAKLESVTMEMPGTLGSAKIVFDKDSGQDGNAADC